MSAAIGADSRPRLPRGVRLRHDEARGEWMLLAPERVLKADAIAVEILKRCTGERDPRARSSTIWPPTFTADRARVDADVARAARPVSRPSGWSTCERARRTIPPPIGLLAELTHRCPLGCPYCSNPLALEPRADELDTATLEARVLARPRPLGVLHVHLSGGEPAARRDLVELVAHCAQVGLYTNLITSGVGLTPSWWRRSPTPASTTCSCRSRMPSRTSADRIAGYRGRLRPQARGGGAWSRPPACR